MIVRRMFAGRCSPPWVAVVAAAILATTRSADAQPPPVPPAGATPLTGLTVTAPPRPTEPPTPRQVHAFVRSIGAMTPAGQLAVWRRGPPPGPSNVLAEASSPSGAGGAAVCPAVFGLPAAYADFIVARVRRAGEAAKAPMAEPGCRRVNALIVFPTDAAAFVHELARKDPTIFGFPYHRELVIDLAAPIRPVRAWYSTETRASGDAASRVSAAHLSIITFALVVVDTRQTEALDMGQIADYIAMITLADLDTGSVPPAAATILNLFADEAAGRTPTEGLTGLDRAYLASLYGIQLRQTGALQESQMTTRIRRELSGR